MRADVLLWRFLSGAHLNGRVRTNAGWFAAGTRLAPGNHRATRWAYLPRAKRAGYRVGAVALLCALVTAYAVSPRTTLAVLGAAVVLGVGWAGWTTWVRFRRWNHDRCVVAPLHSAAAALLQWPGHDRPTQLVQVPLNYSDPDAVVRIAIPDHWQGTDEQRYALTTLVERRLGGEWDAAWHLKRSPLSVELTPAPAPPRVAPFSAMRADIAASTEGQVVLGLGTRGEIIRHDFDAEAPHLGASIGTGGGKSTILRGIIAQVLHAGRRLPDGVDGPTEALVIDPKHVSLDCMEDVPGVRICTQIPDQWAAIHEFREMMEHRYEILRTNKSAVFRRRLLILEEQNTFAAKSYQYWSEIRTNKDPAKPPVFADIAMVLFEGRQAMCNVVGVYQQMNARATGGSDLRDQFGGKILARFSQQAWGFLVGTYPRPRSSKHPGRGVMVLGDEHQSVQLVRWSETEARDWALDGRAPAPSVRPDVSVPTCPDEAPADAQRWLVAVPDAPEEPDPSTQAAPPVIVGLQAAAEHLGTSAAAFEKARQRARRAGGGIPGEFTQDGSPAWPADALTEWQANRPRAGARAAC